MPTDTHRYEQAVDVPPALGDNTLLTSAEVASLAKISRSTIGRAIKAGKLTPLRTPGGHLRFRRSDVEALLTSEASA